jgi:NAD(P)-dependent dehydrogenase (short-subunit alcohol dehydrogenase family)
MIRELDGKIAIITGASRGIGRSIALTFAENGARIVLASRNKYGELDEVANEVRGISESVLSVPTNLGKTEDIERLVGEAKREFGRIDILVNNAASNPAIGPLIDTEERTWDHVMNVNLKGCFLLSQRVARVMVDQREGCIINIASVDGIRLEPGFVPYSISKAGLIMLSEGFAKELGQYGIRVIAVAPGLVRTKYSEAIWGDEKIRREREKKSCLGRIGTPEEIANVVLFLASEKASYITGTTIVIDGGKLAT